MAQQRVQQFFCECVFVTASGFAKAECSTGAVQCVCESVFTRLGVARVCVLGFGLATSGTFTYPILSSVLRLLVCRPGGTFAHDAACCVWLL